MKQCTRSDVESVSVSAQKCDYHHITLLVVHLNESSGRHGIIKMHQSIKLWYFLFRTDACRSLSFPHTITPFAVCVNRFVVCLRIPICIIIRECFAFEKECSACEIWIKSEVGSPRATWCGDFKLDNNTRYNLFF